MYIKYVSTDFLAGTRWWLLVKSVTSCLNDKSYCYTVDSTVNMAPIDHACWLILGLPGHIQTLASGLKTRLKVTRWVGLVDNLSKEKGEMVQF